MTVKSKDHVIHEDAWGVRRVFTYRRVGKASRRAYRQIEPMPYNRGERPIRLRDAYRVRLAAQGTVEVHVSAFLSPETAGWLAQDIDAIAALAAARRTET